MARARRNHGGDAAVDKKMFMRDGGDSGTALGDQVGDDGARSSGILAGPSTGATLAVAMRVARDVAPNSNIVFIACDAGWKYFSAGIGDGNLDEMEDALEGDVFWW